MKTLDKESLFVLFVDFTQALCWLLGETNTDVWTEVAGLQKRTVISRKITKKLGIDAMFISIIINNVSEI